MQTSMERLKHLLTVVFVAAFAVSLLFNVRQCTTESRREASGEITRTIVVDTIPYYLPVPKDSIVIRYVTEKLPTVPPKETGNNEPGNIPSAGADSAEVVIPITQKVYRDSTYTAYVSGYRASLDSLFVYPRQEIITLRPPSKPRRWSIGIQAGYGMTLKGTPQFTPYIGIGIQYNLFNF